MTTSNQFPSGSSVISFGTSKSSVSRFSRKVTAAQDAIIISQATSQAVHAAKAILDAGGSEVTALKTAKAAAVSALMPDNSTESEISSGIGTSFLRRRRLKRRAEVVASMALASAMASSSGEGDDWGGSSIPGMKLVNGPTSSETLATKESMSYSGEAETIPPPSQRQRGRKNLNQRQSAAQMISRKLQMIPSLSTTFSSSGGSGQPPPPIDEEGLAGLGESSSGDQHSSFSNSSRGQDTYSTNPGNFLLGIGKTLGEQLPMPNAPNMRKKQAEKTSIFPIGPGCFNHTYSMDEVSISMDSDMMSVPGPVDSLILSIMNVLSCGPPSGERPTEIRVPSKSMSDIEEECADYAEEEIIFDRQKDVVKRSSTPRVAKNNEQQQQKSSSSALKRSNEKKATKAGDGGDANKGNNNNNMSNKKGEEKGTDAEHDAPFMAISASLTGESSASGGTTGEEILMDLMGNKPASDGRGSTKMKKQTPLAASTKRNTFELKVPSLSEEIDELTMDSLDDDEGENNENLNFIQMQLFPLPHQQRRPRHRMSRGGYNKLPSPPRDHDTPGLTPLGSNPAFTNRGGIGLFRKNSNRRRTSKVLLTGEI